VTGPRDDAPEAGPPVGPELERRLREALARHEAREGAPGEDAPAPEALHDALAGRLPEEERVRVIDRAARTAAGRRELATLHVALGAAEEASPGAGARRAAWWLRPTTAAAAAVVLAAGLGGGVWWRMLHGSPNTPAEGDPLRSTAAGAPIALVAPEVEAAAGGAPPTLAWRAVPGAVGYEVEVLTPTGALVHAARTSDTTLALPAAAVPAAGAAYEWWVRARVPGGEARRSATGRIRGR
jgi:hypothetical protein